METKFVAQFVLALFIACEANANELANVLRRLVCRDGRAEVFLLSDAGKCWRRKG